MAVGQAQAPLSIPNVSELVGIAPPAVTPSSVAQMSEALRQGFITADDIIARTGKRAQLREKADVMALTEQMSPEAVQARQQNLRESLMRSRLGAAQAESQLPLVQPTADLAQSQLQTQIAYQKYPAAKLFDQYAPVLGLEEPMTPDKQIDWSRKASIGVQIAEHLRLQNEAKEKLSNITTEKSADGSVIAAFTKQGLPVDSSEVQRLETQSRSPFKLMTPGTVSTAPAPAVVPAQPATPQVEFIGPTPETAARWRAQLINQGVTTAAQMSDNEVGQVIESQRRAQMAAQPAVVAATTAAAPAKPVVQPAAAPTAPAIGQPVGAGFSLGPPKPTATTSGLTHYTETQQKALGALVRGLASDDALLNQTQKDPKFDPASAVSKLRMDAYKGGTMGQIAATVGQITPAERSYASAANAWIQGLLRAESGAAIATKEQSWYEQTFFPAVGDPQSIQQQKANLRKSIEQTFEQVIEGKMTPDEYAVFRDTIRSANTTPTPAAPGGGGTGPVVDIPGVGRVQRGTDGKYYRVP